MPIELDNKEFQNVWRLVSSTNSSVFMTGRAGTGKSTFLRYIVENIRKKTIVVAPTGIAAVNAGGVTLHSLFRIPMQPFALDDVNYSDPGRVKAMQKFNSDKITLLQEVELIVIDEVSMVRADVLDFVDRVLRTYVRGRNRVPFGGKQLLLVGDAFQLEPVVSGNDWDILRRFYRIPYFFGANVFGQISLVQVELQKVYRQKESNFLALLDRVRVGQVHPADLALINSRVSPTFEPPPNEMYITLTATRRVCDAINDKHLAELSTPEFTFEGAIVGEFPDTALPTNMQLTLKEGAQVVFVRNDKEHRWYNGTIGRVVEFEEEGVWIEVEAEREAAERESDGGAGEAGGNTGEYSAADDASMPATDRFFVERETWENVRYRYDEQRHEVKTEVLGTFSQLPIKLAWAITIHKSQGLTFDRAIIDLGSGAFACGQVYVALSRCRTLDGIVLRVPVNFNDIRTSPFVRDFSYGANNQQLINDQLNKAKARALIGQASAAFRERDFRTAVNSLLDSFLLEPEQMRSEAGRRLLARRLALVSKLDAQIEGLLGAIERQKEKNFTYAYEYYLMGVECLRKYDDSRSAKANLNKALTLAPDYADALLLRGEVCLDGGDNQQALDDLTAALADEKLSPRKRTEALRLRAQAYAGLRSYQKAYNDLIEVMRDSKQRDADTLRFCASVCRRIDKTDEAKAFDALADQKEFDDNDDDDDF